MVKHIYGVCWEEWDVEYFQHLCLLQVVVLNTIECILAVEYSSSSTLQASNAVCRCVSVQKMRTDPRAYQRCGILMLVYNLAPVM